MFTGDAEEDILENDISIAADVLQVGHHGSKTASAVDFIKAVSPEYAVISCAEDNEYGHPHAATLNTLRTNQVKLFRTDEQGSLVATSDGKKITWNAAPSEIWKAGELTKTTTVRPDKNMTTKDKSLPVIEKPKHDIKQDNIYTSYVLNTKTKKFHYTTPILMVFIED